MLYINNKIELPLKRTLAITASQTFIFKMFFYIFFTPASFLLYHTSPPSAIERRIADTSPTVYLSLAMFSNLFDYTWYRINYIKMLRVISDYFKFIQLMIKPSLINIIT